MPWRPSISSTVPILVSKWSSREEATQYMSFWIIYRRFTEASLSPEEVTAARYIGIYTKLKLTFSWPLKCFNTFLFRYTIAGSEKAREFFLINEITGEVYIKRPLSEDNPDTDSYTIIVRSNDLGTVKQFPFLHRINYEILSDTAIRDAHTMSKGANVR